ncbi:MAG: sigma-54-dependent Fis family transcriptional regulator [Candidatus Tectomicrobia bacterium]|uniref:Sigma-54-dependent Fis family transcriptional regulator n=1 Tax=Tectimicrobiota bacterium TaxID=2528274 RepID=A0A932FXQ4_UNCTE|nr:sigma-54-dependent Fis family transcriptional regulator [Candidatus Tectomicrobia bacterium]
MKSQSILIIDDDEGMRDTLEVILRREYQVLKAASGEQGLMVLKDQEVSLVFLDIRMPGMNGLEVLQEIKRFYPGMIVVMISVVTDPDTVARALALGAQDYLTKEFDYDQVRHRCRQFLKQRERELEIISLKSELDSTRSTALILGPNPAIKKLCETLPDVSRTKSPILITGETGTGKELWARYIHSLSPRQDKPLITTNLAAIPDSLVESTLFGHKAGAFTGATQNQLGKFELAHGGTLFLDEIGCMDMGSQGKLLRALQAGEIQTVGESRAKRVNVRIISATNTDLAQAIKQGCFREDLYYRLSRHPIHLPPLRERREDIPVLVDHFRKKYNQELNRDVAGIEPEALEILREYPWPGNIRELENLMERLVLTGRGKRITRVDLLFDRFIPLKEERKKEKEKALMTVDLSQDLKSGLRSYEKRYLQEVLQRYPRDIRAAIRHAKISRRSFYQKIKDYGIKPGETP